MRRLRTIFALLLVFLLTGCPDAQPSQPPGPPPTQAITYKMPLFTPAPETKELQEKSGLEISVIPVQYETKESIVHDPDRELSTGTSRQFSPAGSVDVPYHVVERTTRGTVSVLPSRVGFIITVNNKMNHVFRGQGAVVQFNVAGRMIAVEQQHYSELSNMIVPPRNQQQVKIYGPPLKDVADGPAPIGLMIYDVVTTTDAAGNPTERQNFEWFYSYTSETKQKEVAFKTEQVTEQTGPATPVSQDQPDTHRRRRSN